MKNRKKIILWSVLALLGILVVLFFAAGIFADPGYSGSKTVVVDASPETIWNILDDTEHFSNSRHEVYKCEMLGTNEKGNKIWREHTRLWGAMNYEVIRQEPNKMIEIKMTGSDFGMSGNWIFLLEPIDEKTQIVINETSRNEGLLMRCILASIGRDANMGLLLNVVRKELKEQSI